MKIRLTAQIKQHAGDFLYECQDSFDYNLAEKTFAISDGVSQAYRPEIWARILTQAYVNNPDIFFVNNNGLITLNPGLGLQKKWHDLERAAYSKATAQDQFLLDMKQHAVPFAAATFIGVHLCENGIEYSAIGDSVLFFFDYETKKLEVISSMIPQNGNMVFNNSPEYIDSEGNNHGVIIQGSLPYKQGLLLMATDALSDWIIERKEGDLRCVFSDLLGHIDHQQYDSFIEKIRTSSSPTKLKDDDTTFVALEIINENDCGFEFEVAFAEKFDNLCSDIILDELKKKSDELDKIMSEKTSLEGRLRRQEKEAIRMEDEIKSFKVELNRKDDQLKEQKDIEQKYKQKESEWGRTVSNLQKEKTKMEGEIRRLYIKSDSETKKWEDSCKRYEEEIKGQLDRIHSLESEKKSLIKKNQELTNENSRLENENKILLSNKDQSSNDAKEIVRVVTVEQEECSCVVAVVDEVGYENKEIIVKGKQSIDSGFIIVK